MNWLIHFFVGYVYMQFDRKYTETALNILREKNIVSWNYILTEDAFTMCTTDSGEKELKNGILRDVPVHICHRGLFSFIKEHKTRVGLAVGVLTAACMWYTLFGFVWDVRIEGNEHISSSVIKDELCEAGLWIGSDISKTNTRRIAEQILLTSRDLSFISINMRGCVAYVTVREREISELPFALVKANNLIASHDAVIESLSVSSGETKVYTGQVVKAGELLVSGITEGLSGTKLGTATGSVVGRVNRRFTVKIPTLQAVLYPQKEKITAISLVFLGKNINIYRNTGNLPTKYVTIYQNEMLYMDYSTPLPFGFVQTYILPQTERKVRLTQEEQVAMAHARLENEMALALKDGELLTKNLYGEFTNDGYILTCDVEYLVNIAISQNIITD